MVDQPILLHVPTVSRQVAFHQLLVAARRTWLVDALSTAHNRAGEAEKSHQKARNQGFRDFWTIVAKRGLDVDKLRRESPTTTSWFDIAQVLGRMGDDWDEFRRRLAGEVGIPIP